MVSLGKQMGSPEISRHDDTTKIRSIKPWSHFEQLNKNIIKNKSFFYMFSLNLSYVHDIHVCVINQFNECYILFVVHVGILAGSLFFFCEQSFQISGNSYIIKHAIVLKSRCWNIAIRLRMDLFVSKNKRTIDNTN